MRGDVIYHKVEHQVIFRSDCSHIIKCAECGIHGFISHGGKSPVCRRGEERQNVHTADRVLIVLIQYLMQVF